MKRKVTLSISWTEEIREDLFAEPEETKPIGRRYIPASTLKLRAYALDQLEFPTFHIDVRDEVPVKPKTNWVTRRFSTL